MNKNNTPRRKRLKRENRVKSAINWIPTYKGKNIVKGYSNWFGVDLICAIKELRIQGVIIDHYYEKQVLKSLQITTLAKNKNIKNKKEHSDGNFKFIAGYTSGGAPYGIRHDELPIDQNYLKQND